MCLEKTIVWHMNSAVLCLFKKNGHICYVIILGANNTCKGSNSKEEEEKMSGSIRIFLMLGD